MGPDKGIFGKTLELQENLILDGPRHLQLLVYHIKGKIF